VSVSAGVLVSQWLRQKFDAAGAKETSFRVAGVEVIDPSHRLMITRQREPIMTDSPTVVLVHGAFADASGFAEIIRRLQAAGISVRAPWNPLRGLAFDADALARYSTNLDGPLVLVGHSYGGAVISQAAPAVHDVRGMVFLSAFAPDEGESCATVQEGFPAALLATANVASAYDAPGAAGGARPVHLDRPVPRDVLRGSA
jgi:pimeloyl-ACP methyl ester carboxylesterase